MNTTEDYLTKLETDITSTYRSIQNLGGTIPEHKNTENISPAIESIYNKLPKVSDTGTDLNLSPTLEARLGLILRGNTEQETYSGKNLLNRITMQYGYVMSSGKIYDATMSDYKGEMYSEFIKVNPNTTYTFSIQETSSTYPNWIGIGEYTSEDINNFVTRKTMTTDTQNYYTFTTNATTQYIIVSARNIADATKVQLEIGNQITSYEPYTGGQPSPNPSYPQMPKVVTGENSVKVENKNLAYDIVYNDVKNKYYTMVYCSYNVVKDEEYIITFDTPNTGLRTYINLPPENLLVRLAGEPYDVALDGTKKTFKVKATATGSVKHGALFSRFSDTSDESTGLLSNIQIQKGTTATDYVEHKEQNYPLSLSSKNLLKLTTASSNGIISIINSDGSISYSGKATATWANITERYYQDLPEGDYTISINKPLDYRLNIRVYYEDETYQSFAIYAGDTFRAFTTNKKIKSYYVFLSNTLAVGEDYNDTLYIQLEEGSTATKYQPYIANPIELCKINNYQDKIYRTSGKNLFEVTENSAGVSNVNYNKISDSSFSMTTTSQGTWRRADILLPKVLEKNTDYTFQFNMIIDNSNVTDIRISFRDSTGTTEALYLNVKANTSYTFNTGDNDIQLLRFYVTRGTSYSVGVTINNFQLEKGSTSTDYEPYGSDKWYLHKEITKMDMSTLTGWKRKADGQFYTMKVNTNYGIISDKVISNIFDYSSTPWSGDFKIGINTSNDLWITTGDSSLTAATMVPDWLSSHNAFMYGILETPTNTEITDTTLIEQLEALYYANSYDGETNITVTTDEDLEMILEASALKGGE